MDKNIDALNPFLLRRDAFDGLCLAIVQSIQKAGAVRIHVTSPELRTRAVTLISHA